MKMVPALLAARTPGRWASGAPKIQPGAQTRTSAEEFYIQADIGRTLRLPPQRGTGRRATDSQLRQDALRAWHGARASGLEGFGIPDCRPKTKKHHITWHASEGFARKDCSARGPTQARSLRPKGNINISQYMCRGSTTAEPGPQIQLATISAAATQSRRMVFWRAPDALPGIEVLHRVHISRVVLGAPSKKPAALQPHIRSHRRSDQAPAHRSLRPPALDLRLQRQPQLQWSCSDTLTSGSLRRCFHCAPLSRFAKLL